MINDLLRHTRSDSEAVRGSRRLLVLVLMLLTGAAVSGDRREWSIDLNGLSRHSESHYTDRGVSHKYNQTNRGLGATVEWSEWRGLVRQSEWTRWIDRAGIDADLKVGFFDNSYHKTSVYAGPFFHKDLAEGEWKFAPGVALLLTSGYQDTPEDAPAVFPLPVLGLEVGHKAARLNLGYVPWGDVDIVTVQLQLVPGYW